MKEYSYRTSWFIVICLAGSVLGIIECLWGFWQVTTPIRDWQISYDLPQNPSEAVLVFIWTSLAYIIPSLILAGIWMKLPIGQNQALGKETSIPASIFPIGIWLVLILETFLLHLGIESISLHILQLLTSIALAIILCYCLRTFLTAFLNSFYLWFIFHGFALSIVSFWLATQYASAGQKLFIIFFDISAVLFCIWSFFAPLQKKSRTLVYANGIAVFSIILLTLWPDSDYQAVPKVGNQPNVLLITIDTLRADHLGCYGYTNGQTTNIDKISDKGVLFEEAHSPTPYTVPSHISILTGMDPLKHGALNNWGMPIRDGVVTLPETLSRHGYYTKGFISGYTLKNIACGLASRFHDYIEDFSM